MTAAIFQELFYIHNVSSSHSTFKLPGDGIGTECDTQAQKLHKLVQLTQFKSDQKAMQTHICKTF